MTPEPLISQLRALGRVREREPLSRHTTVGIGGPADLYIKVESAEALMRVLDAARRHAVPWFILGAGSNLLVGDGGIRGIVVEYDAKAIDGPAPQPDGKARFTIEAGASFAWVARRLAKLGYAGLEWGAGIPGTLGGAVATNAGAYGGSLADVLVSVRIGEPGTAPRALPASLFRLAYRESVFTLGLLKDVAILSVTVDLTPDDPAAILARIEAMEANRKASQPQGQNTGSVFKNPPGRSAWQLIDAAGLRGHRIGGAQITDKHCNFFANVANARAADFKALMDLARARVRERFGVELEPEVWLVGAGFDAQPTPPAPSLKGGGASTDGSYQPDQRLSQAEGDAGRDVPVRLPLPSGRGPGGGSRNPKRRVAVLFGGRSGEHTVSVISGRSVLRYLDRNRFDVIPLAITRGGAWLTPAETAAQLARIEGQQFATIEAEGEGLLSRPEMLGLLADVDAVFPMLHGYQGEDGTIQGLLELTGVPYVGAGVTASAIGMDKAVQKALWRQAGLPVVDHLVLLRSDVERDGPEVARRVEGTLGYPCFVKPSNGGSSVGVSKVRSREDLGEALAEAGRWDRKVIVERFMAARELDCAVLGNDDPEAAPLGEVIPAREFYDFAAKYDDAAGTQLLAPAPVSEELTRRVHEIAIAAYKAVDCAGMARVDFFLTAEGEPVLNEINTIPGFTHMSMYPRLWGLAGLSYPDLLTRLIDLGIERHRQTRGAHLHDATPRTNT